MPNSLFKLPSNTKPPNGRLREVYDAEVRKTQSNDPAWKQAGRNLIDIVANIPKGLFGVQPNPNESNAGYVANAMTQLGSSAEAPLKAALPFAAMKPLRVGAMNNFRMPRSNDAAELALNKGKGVLQSMYDVEADPAKRRAMMLAKFDQAIGAK